MVIGMLQSLSEIQGYPNRLIYVDDVFMDETPLVEGRGDDVGVIGGLSSKKK